MRLFLQYLRGKAGKIAAFFLFAVIFIVSFALYHLPLAAVWYPSALCMALALLIPFSRLYLGVHTPLDVGVSFVVGWLLVLAFYPLLEEIGHRGEVLERIWLILLVPAALFLLYALRVRAGASGDAANFDHAVKTAWSMLGLVLGAIVSVFADRHYTRFETQAVWWAQLLKVVLGLALTLAVRVALKAPLTAAFGANT